MKHFSYIKSNYNEHLKLVNRHLPPVRKLQFAAISFYNKI